MKTDCNLVKVVDAIPGVTVSHHYQTREGYYIHVSVESNDALDGLIKLAERANSPLHVYGDSKSGYRYSLVVNARSRAAIVTGPHGDDCPEPN